MTIVSKDVLGDDRRIPRAALVIGWAGLVPFVSGAVALFMTAPGAGYQGAILVPLLAYGALILSFLGGARWALAFAIRDEDAQARQLALSLLPPLLAWIALCLYVRPLLALTLLILGHAAQGAWDVATARAGGCPAWYGTLRLQLTCAAVAALGIVGLAVLVSGHTA